MKVYHLFIPIFAAMAFIGCSNEEEINSGRVPAQGETGYVAVNIVQPKSVGKRAATTGNFENGSNSENNAREGLFFILNDNGDVLTIDGNTSQRITLSGSETTETPAVERIYNAILVIDGIKEDPKNTTKQIVCILNAPEGLETGVTKLSQLQEKIEDYCTGHISDGTFVMSNSVYKNGNNIIVGTPVTADKIKTSAAAALASPVDIYVERVVAKVRAAEKDGGMTVNEVELDVDGVKKKYKINIDGMALSNLTDKAYLFKSIDGYTATWEWNDTPNFRSFWEMMPSTGVTVNKISWNDIDKDTHYNASATAGTKCFEQYILPNTFTQNNTSIIIAAHLTDADNNNADLVWIRGGYTTDKGALNIIATAVSTKYAYYKKTGDTSFETLAPDDFEWKEKADGYGCYAQLKTTFGTDNKVYTFSGNTATEVIEGTKTVNTYLSTEANNLYARKYTDGKSYYFVNIEHVAATGTGSTATPAIKGIVRNHIYDLTLNSISGPGVPVFNPDNKVIPQEPVNEDLFYLGARVNVLDWRIVTQGVDFGKTE